MIGKRDSTLKIFNDLSLWANELKNLEKQNVSIGFVPTMGALHQGHSALLDRSRRENQVTVLSIYVNATQFDNKDDLAKYPKTLERDQEIAAEHGVDYILLPTYEQIYPDGYRYKVTENDFSNQLCGAYRPGHFDGVLTVVMKLLNIVSPKHAYFGEKDYQQLQLITDMVKSFFMNVQVVPCTTVREADGLAMSSRNVRLTTEERALAPQFAKILRETETTAEAPKRYAAKGSIRLARIEARET